MPATEQEQINEFTTDDPREHAIAATRLIAGGKAIHAEHAREFGTDVLDSEDSAYVKALVDSAQAHALIAIALALTSSR